jgi:hypothetical protein
MVNFSIENKNRTAFPSGNPAIPLEKLFAGPAVFRLPIARDLALSRDNRKSPQKGSCDFPEGIILSLLENCFHSVSNESKFRKYGIFKLLEKLL